MTIDKLKWSDNICTVGWTNFWCILDADGMRYIRERYPEARFTPTWGGINNRCNCPDDLERYQKETGHGHGGFYVDGRENDMLFQSLLRELFPEEWTEKYWTPTVERRTT